MLQWLLPCAMVLATGPQAQAAPVDDHAEIIRLEDAWRTARVQRDLAFLERFYAHDVRIHDINGKRLSRADSIARYTSGEAEPSFIRHGPLEVTISGETAVVTGIDHVGGRSFGNYGEMRVRFTDVLVKRDGRWQLLVQQATRTQDKG